MIKRYDTDTFNGETESFEDANGCWVTYADHADALAAARAESAGEVERLRVQLAGCLCAAEGNLQERPSQGDYGWSLSYERTVELRQGYEQLRTELDLERALTREKSARIAALASPPVVPEGWTVQPVCGWWTYSAKGPASEHTFDKAHFPAVLRALAWAIENDARPPHAADVKGGG